MQGFVHSFETMGCADGPGVRFIAFLQGCPLRCAYCHNPDTWAPQEGQVYSASDIIDKAMRYQTYFGKDGGITVSGGEPLAQSKFLIELLKTAKQYGLHTAIDTSCSAGEADWAEVLKYTDLVLADLKFATEDAYKEHCGGSLQTVLRFLKATEEAGVDLWIRHVVVPGMTDTDLDEIIKIASQFENLKRIELLPFRKLCKAKYENLGIPFPLLDTPECDATLLENLKAQIPEQYR